MSMNILVVDDAPDFRKTVRGILVDGGYVVQAVTNESEALTAIVREHFDLALIDVRLHDEGEEDQSGLSLAMAIRSLKPKTHVILLTKYVRADQVVRAVRYHGVTDFIDKSNSNWSNLLLKTVKEIQETQQEETQPELENSSGGGQNHSDADLHQSAIHSRTSLNRLLLSSDISRLSISLTQNQPLTARSRGRHVYSLSTPEILQIREIEYARKVEMAKNDRRNRRFLVKDIGGNLYCDIFDKHFDLKGTYLEARAKSKVLTLQFETAREFVNLPLEFIRSDQPEEYLILQHPLSRFVLNAVPRNDAISPQSLAILPKLKILLIASNTLPAIDGVDTEISKLQMFLNNQEFFPVEVDTIESHDSSTEAVREILRHCDYDIVHYAGHGDYKVESPEESSIYFWEKQNKQGNVLPMTGAELKVLLDQSNIRFVYLSSCFGTSAGSDIDLLNDDFLGLADAVVQAGIPSVLGYRWPASDVSAPKLALAFYRSLLEHGSPEIALWQARRELAVNRDDTTWLSPILIHQA